MSKFTNFDGYWFKPKGMVYLVWIGGTGVLQSILSSLILNVNYTFAFKPITIKFGKFTNFWMLFQMTCPIFNSIDTEYSYQEKICSYPVPCSFRTWPILLRHKLREKLFSVIHPEINKRLAMFSVLQSSYRAKFYFSQRLWQRYRDCFHVLPRECYTKQRRSFNLSRKGATQ